jgi:uncharacterized membrane protein YgcG
MGSTRNLTETEKATTRPPWEEQDCCPDFLAALCPTQLFTLSQKRSELPPCEHAVHNPSIRAEFQRAKLPILATYQHQLLDKLRNMVQQMDERVVKAIDRVKLEAASVDLEPGLKKATEALGELQATIAALVSRAEEAGDEGDVETAEKSLADVDELTKQKKMLEAQLAATKEFNPMRVTGTMFGQQDVCPVCCSVTNTKDELNNERHREGQMHIGWTQIREETIRLEKRTREVKDVKGDSGGGGGGRRSDGGGSGGGSGGGGVGGGAAAPKDGEEEEEKEEGEVRDEAGGRAGGHRGRNRSCSRSRDRHRNRDGGGYKYRSRSRDRDRERDRDGGGHRKDDRYRRVRDRSRSRSLSRDGHRRESRDREVRDYSNYHRR